METIRIALFAFAIVLAGMAVLMGVCEILRRLSMPRERAEAAIAPERVDARTMAVLAAAVAEALGTRVRIHRVHVHRGETERWSRAGRMDVMISHRVGPTR